MVIFCYGFGVALAVAFGIAIGNAWIRDHRIGIWDRKTAFAIVGTSIVLGVIVGWALQQYLTFVFLSQTTRQ
jgi:hypothetical protein